MGILLFNGAGRRSIPTLSRAFVAIAALAASAIGCQSARPIATHRLLSHQAVIDFSGLKPAADDDALRVNAAVPRNWDEWGPNKAVLYRDAQWHGPSGHTAVGVVYIHVPLPMSTDLLLFLAKHEYAHRSADGKMLAEWKDALGRSWFEAETQKYHVQGYALAQGFEGWIVYFGYRTDEPPEMSEISLAARSAETFVPRVNGASLSAPRPMAGPTTRPETR